MKRAVEDIEEILKQLGLLEEYRLEILRKKIKTLLKDPLCRHVYPSSLKNGQLVMVVGSRQLMLTLKSLEQELLNSLREFGVRSLRFRIGKIKTEKDKLPSSEPQRKPSLSPDILTIVDNYIRDEALKQTIIKAILASMSKVSG
jgi:hypothetical protein